MTRETDTLIMGKEASRFKEATETIEVKGSNIPRESVSLYPVNKAIHPEGMSTHPITEMNTHREEKGEMIGPLTEVTLNKISKKGG